MKNNAAKTMLKEAGILFAITLIAGIMLGMVNELTKNPIAEQKQIALNNACKEVFEAAENFELLSLTPGDVVAAKATEDGVELGNVYGAYDGSKKLLGYVIEATSGQGYGGDIQLMLGVTMEGTLNGISILSISETPGLGMRAKEILVPQFVDKPVTTFTYTKTGATGDSQIDAISGATITTKAVTNAVNAGLFYYTEELSEGGMSNE